MAFETYRKYQKKLWEYELEKTRSELLKLDKEIAKLVTKIKMKKAEKIFEKDTERIFKRQLRAWVRYRKIKQRVKDFK